MTTIPVLKNNIIYLTITEEFYVFGSCDGYKVVPRIEPEHCWVSIDNDKIICGNDAYKLKNEVRFQIFTIIPDRNEYVTQFPKGIQLSNCYDSMLEYINKKIFKTIKNQIDSIVLIVSPTIILATYNYIKQNIRRILSEKNSQIKIQSYTLSSAFEAALYYEVANTRQPGQEEEPEYNEEKYFLTINFDNTKTQIELFKGHQYHGIEKTITIGINDDDEKPKYLRIFHDTYEDIKKLINLSKEINQGEEILKLENQFRKLLNGCILESSEKFKENNYVSSYRLQITTNSLFQSFKKYTIEPKETILLDEVLIKKLDSGIIDVSDYEEIKLKFDKKEWPDRKNIKFVKIVENRKEFLYNCLIKKNILTTYWNNNYHIDLQKHTSLTFGNILIENAINDELKTLISSDTKAEKVTSWEIKPNPNFSTPEEIDIITHTFGYSQLIKGKAILGLFQMIYRELNQMLVRESRKCQNFKIEYLITGIRNPLFKKHFEENCLNEIQKNLVVELIQMTKIKRYNNDKDFIMRAGGYKILEYNK